MEFKTNKMKKLSILLLAVLLIGCKKIEEGTIVGKWHEDPSVYVMVMPMVISTGKTTTTTMIPYTIYDGEDFCIRVRGLNKKGKEVEKTYYLDRYNWEKLSEGDSICIDGNCFEEDQTYKKEKKQ